MGLYGVPFAKPTVSLAPCFNFKKLARNLARCQVHFRSAEKGEKASGRGGVPLDGLASMSGTKKILHRLKNSSLRCFWVIL